MSLAPGDLLGPYQILAPIGAGGMGEVYKSRDTRLDRLVAIKVSKDQFSERFEREARAVAALNHPHICQLYDVGPNYLVMEFIEGVPLKGPLPIDKAVEHAGQILDALDAAHKKNITHRDLKPTNILVTKQGIKLLDFGLAKRTTPLKDTDATLTAALTSEGQIVGTLQYMSPEQLQSRDADARSDIFAFGCVLYELLTGKRAFEGSNAASVIAAIMERPAPSVSDVAPASLDRVLKTCLAKNPDQRWQAALDLKRNLLWAIESEASGKAISTVPWRWMAAAVAITAAALGFVAYRHATEDPPQVLRVSVLPPEKAIPVANSLPALSPDGRRLAFAATAEGKTLLWIRDLEALDARSLTGTENAFEPFWSPDGKSVAFFADGRLKRVDVAGGPVLTLCPASTSAYGGTWSSNGVIVFTASPGPLLRVPAAGGSPVPATVMDETAGELSHRLPWFLPDGRHFLYSARRAGGGDIYVADLESKQRTLVLKEASNAVYVPQGFLLFVRDRTLMAQPFDLASFKLTGDAQPVAEKILNGKRIWAQFQFTASRNGVLAYSSGAFSGQQYTWFDRTGKPLGTLGPPGSLGRPAISPDGLAVAADHLDTATGLGAIWLYDLTRGTASRFTSGGSHSTPAWSPDGSRLAYASREKGLLEIAQRAVNGAGQEEIFSQNWASAIHEFRNADFSRDGRYLVMENATASQTGFDIWVFPLIPDAKGERKAVPLVATPAQELHPRISPDSHWLAYAAGGPDSEVYVETFPNPGGGKRQISSGGGSQPVWSRDGKELYYIARDQKLMAVEVKASGSRFEVGPPKPLFHSRIEGGFTTSYDVSKDGRFLIPAELDYGSVTPFTVVVNWTAGLKK